MAHFAKVVNGIVTNVIVAEPEFFDTFTDDFPNKSEKYLFLVNVNIIYCIY